MHYREFWEAGFQVFGLYGRGRDGKCQCGNPHCPEKSLFKHPRVSNWQHTPHWSDEQMETMEAMDQFDVPGIVFSSSCTVYGQPESLPVNENAPVLKANSPTEIPNRFRKRLFRMCWVPVLN
jgi:hypothetical protein